MSSNQVEFSRVKHWLERKVRARAAANLTIAITHVILGAILVTGTAWALAWLLMLGFEHAVDIARHNFGFHLGFHRTERGVLLLAGLMLVLLFVGNSRSEAINLRKFSKLNWRSREGTFATLALIGGLFTRGLYIGPHLLSLADGFFRKWQLWQKVELDVLASVLHLLAAEGKRVAFEEIARRVPNFSHSRTVPQLHLIEGILFLTSPPTGLGLTSALRDELTGQTPRPEPSHHQPHSHQRPNNDGPSDRIRSRRVVFMCSSCRLKLRVLIASENIAIKCPRCRAVYRVTSIADGRIQMQRVTSGFRQRKPPVPPPLPSKPREPFDHEMLGVKPDATAEEIKNAYRKLLKENHPDFFANAAPAERAKSEEFTKQLNQAYRSMMLRFDK